jgi:hypothetical protein
VCNFTAQPDGDPVGFQSLLQGQAVTMGLAARRRSANIRVRFAPLPRLRARVRGEFQSTDSPQEPPPQPFPASGGRSRSRSITRIEAIIRGPVLTRPDGESIWFRRSPSVRAVANRHGRTIPFPARQRERRCAHSARPRHRRITPAPGSLIRACRCESRRSRPLRRRHPRIREIAAEPARPGPAHTNKKPRQRAGAFDWW